ncbi:Zn-ribbon domain-containing OB-fold protein [Novosphingobium album (ex Liu et al. 2023)]|uniref:Zn-ribbon domain-containing OB-fold protein n=1 Tax=Novosphingobium album (ex Liu et al. 2023) TaxID=3031130 RepID=A0ABT5WX95_9SPHN|nr:Zn-ribbon domain-containing OB-fold protein [Novosphingobium album (ex Liu et al. 2023)]MDE8654520.1 Zn-ribbon domain-containing OB-fold protein [Novosphingobium album (ex Liu et al. 2023)]
MPEIALAPPTDLFRLETDRWTAPFWEAAAQGRLAVPRCGACGTFRLPPTPFCPACRSQALDWVTLSGRGTLYAFTVVRRAGLPGMEGHIPFVPAVVELPDADGARLVTNIVDTPIAEIRIGMSLALVWRRTADGTQVPRFCAADTHHLTEREP